ncbi:MAG: hypothetical protein ACKVS8_14820 [Phycisphaerales bacterium]
MCGTKRPSEDELLKTVLDIVNRAATKNLPLAYAVVQGFAQDGGPGGAILSAEHRIAADRALQAALWSGFKGPDAAERLLAAMRSGSPWVVYWIAWTMKRIQRQPLEGLPFDNWPEFADTLLASAERDPIAGMPLIVPFITQSRHTSDPVPDEEGRLRMASAWIGDFDVEAARQLFDVPRLLAVALRIEIPANTHPEMQSRLGETLRWARETAAA